MEPFALKHNLCTICPRHCGINRKHSLHDSAGTVGFCQMGRLPVLARAGVHWWEEPCISGTRGSGTVFFSGCNLRCCFCQNYSISTQGFGEEISVERLCAIYSELAAQGVHNINLVNPSHFTEAIAQSLAAPLPVPVVYNSGGYDAVEALQMLEGKVQIYLPDLKYADDALSQRYSGTSDYFAVATAAIEEMFRQVGPWRMDANGMLQSGVLVRHLILPGETGAQNAFGVIDWIAERFQPGEVLFSLMRQYTPCGNASQFPELAQPLSERAYHRVEQYLLCTNIEDGYLQDAESVGERFIPPFDLSGVHAELGKGSATQL